MKFYLFWTDQSYSGGDDALIIVEVNYDSALAIAYEKVGERVFRYNFMEVPIREGACIIAEDYYGPNLKYESEPQRSHGVIHHRDEYYKKMREQSQDKIDTLRIDIKKWELDRNKKKAARRIAKINTSITFYEGEIKRYETGED